MVTRNYATFALANDLGKTVHELLTGVAAPMSNMELYLWGRWQLARARIEQQQRRGM